MVYYLAVDGGGTKTDVLCADEQGQIVGEGHSGPTNLTATNVGAASFNLREAVRQATEHLPQGWQVQKLSMGLAGMDTPLEEAQATKVFRDVLSHLPIADFQLVNDIVIALESGTDKADAVALISGTGSNCYGRNAEGQSTKTGGMDYLLTDQGSGYAIGRRVLRMAVKSFDGRSEKSIFEELVKAHFKIDTIANLKDAVYNPPLSKSEIASLTKLCVTAFEQGDALARDVFDWAVGELHLMISTVVTKLGMTNRPVDCVLVGGVTTIDYVHTRLEEKLRGVCPQISVIRPSQAPVYGALKLARR